MRPKPKSISDGHGLTLGPQTRPRSVLLGVGWVILLTRPIAIHMSTLLLHCYVNRYVTTNYINLKTKNKNNGTC